MRDSENQPPDQGGQSEIELLRKQVEYLRTLVHTDELTGLSNLRHFNDTLSLELERTRRSGQPTCLILLDIDNFKAVNDNYGHEVGNSVLCHLAGVIRRTLRRLDTPCRLGGDEFAIILPATNLEQGHSLANRLQSRLHRSPFRLGAIDLKIHASLGVGAYEPENSQITEATFFRTVDQLLYQSKQNNAE